MKKSNFILIVLGIWVASSCNKIPKDDVEPYKGKDYFPVNIGHELVYDVVHVTKINQNGTFDTSRYQIKEIISATYKDSLGRETQQVERFIKNDTTTGFELYKIWSANLLTSTGQRVEDQIRYIKLYFPQYLDKNWDANSLNSLGGRYYKYLNLHVPFTLGSLTFDSTCTVQQFKDSTSKKACYDMERYATNVGMIYKINQNIQFSSADTISSASVYSETLVSFKK